jgi:SSS family solute:Na+ symporter
VGLFLNLFFGDTLLPTFIQRLLIGKNAKETTRATYWGGFMTFPFFLMIGIIGLTALTLKPDLDPHLALPFVINDVMPIGLKGLAIAGLLAVLMSSVDSFINGASVGLSHDVIKPLWGNSESDTEELRWSRLTTISLGLLSAVFALKAKSALDILLFAYNFWTPFILVPLVVVILGFNVTAKAFWWGACAGILATTLWFVQMGDTLFSGAIIGVTVNGVVFFTVNKWYQRKLESQKLMETA